MASKTVAVHLNAYGSLCASALTSVVWNNEPLSAASVDPEAPRPPTNGPTGDEQAAAAGTAPPSEAAPLGPLLATEERAYRYDHDDDESDGPKHASLAYRRSGRSFYRSPGRDP